jgi:hypothetical protein
MHTLQTASNLLSYGSKFQFDTKFFYQIHGPDFMLYLLNVTAASANQRNA